MAGLLVSVRSVEEASAALAGGASIIDIKEPDRGPLGCADVAVWQRIRNALPVGTIVSVALGELDEWSDRLPPTPAQFAGIRFRKIGLAGTGAGWRAAWNRLRAQWGAGPAWVAVAYADWRHAGAPAPDLVLDAALAAADCAAILVDTWDKNGRSSERVDESWRPWFARARQGGLKTALAGGIDGAAIARLAALEPDWFAVRGAACRGGDRRALVDSSQVAELVRCVEMGAAPREPAPMAPAARRPARTEPPGPAGASCRD